MYCVFEGGETARNQTESSRSFFLKFERANYVEFWNLAMGVMDFWGVMGVMGG